MKRLLSATLFVTCVLALSPVLGAQDCSGWTNWALHGTYTMAGSGWLDPSKLEPAMPAGMVPQAFVGAFRLDGKGGFTGWGSSNFGGVQMNFQLVDGTYAVKADCSVQISFSMDVKELGKTYGPFSRLAVIYEAPGMLELRAIFVGSAPGGAPGGEVDLLTARRISTQQ